MHFIYVMKQEDKDKLVELGYQLLKEAPGNSVWVFRASDTMAFGRTEELDDTGVSYVLSDVLTF